MESTLGIRGTLFFVCIYMALGYPEMSRCIENGGQIESCALTGLVIGGFKAIFYALSAVVTGLIHLFAR